MVSVGRGEGVQLYRSVQKNVLKKVLSQLKNLVH